MELQTKVRIAENVMWGVGFFLLTWLVSIWVAIAVGLMTVSVGLSCVRVAKGEE